MDLELEELEAAAQMVVEDEEEVGAGESSPTSCSSSSSSEESKASEAEEEGCVGLNEVGGGGGGETCKDNPPQLRHSSSGSPIPQEPSGTRVSPARTTDAPTSSSGGSSRLIQELEERVAQELQISQDSRDAAEGSCSPADRAAESSGRTLLEPGPRRNPLLIVTSQDDQL